MGMSTKKILSKIDECVHRVEAAVSREEEFAVLHEDILNFCNLIFDKKAEYREIDVEYPNKNIVKIKSFSDEPDQEFPNKNMQKENRERLALNINGVLAKAKRFYSLKVELEESDSNGL